MMKRALVILVFPLVMVGQQVDPKKIPLDRVMEQFAMIDLQAPDSAYRSILMQMRRHGTVLEDGIRRLTRQRGSALLSALHKTGGLGNADVNEMQRWVIRAKQQPKKNYVQREGTGLLPADFERYATDLFKKKRCRGGLCLRHEPGASSLIRLSDDIHVDMLPRTTTISACDYAEYVLEFNDQFLVLDRTMQRALVHFFIGKIEADHALWNALLMKKIKVKRSVIGLMAVAQSPQAKAYRQHMTMEALGQCIIDDPQLAGPLEALFTMYQDDYHARQQTNKQSRSYFDEGYVASCAWIKRLRRFVAVEQQIDQAQ